MPSKAQAQTTTPTFTDVPSDYWAFNQIEAVAAAGFMNGYADATFKPNDIASRAMAAVALYRAAGLTTDPNQTTNFSDVSNDYWAFKEIEAVNKAGYMTGYGDGTFKPDNSISRREIANVLYRAKGLNVNVSESSFADVLPTDPSLNQIEAIYLAGYTNGCGLDAVSGKPLFCPDAVTNRDALAVFLYNAYLKVVPDGFRIIKTAEQNTYPVRSGDKVIYVLTYLVGDQPVYNVVGDDPLSSAVTYDQTSVLPTGCLYQETEHNVHCEIPSIAANTIDTVRFAVTVK